MHIASLGRLPPRSLTVTDWHLEGYTCASSGSSNDFTLPAQLSQPFLHVSQTVCPRLRRTGLEATPIVLEGYPQHTLLHCNLNAQT